jgi:hypothetical protein
MLLILAMITFVLVVCSYGSGCSNFALDAAAAISCIALCMMCIAAL